MGLNKLLLNTFQQLLTLKQPLCRISKNQCILQNKCIWNILCGGGHQWITWSTCGPRLFFPKYSGTPLLNTANSDHFQFLLQTKTLRSWKWSYINQGQFHFESELYNLEWDEMSESK